MHYNGIKHELKFYNDFELIKALKELVTKKRIYKYTESNHYKTSIYTTHRVTKTHRLNYHNTIESCIKYLNAEKGYKLEIPITNVLKKIEKRVLRRFKNPKDERRDIDVYSDHFLIECKNWSRSQKITCREVHKFIDNLNLLSQTPLREGKKAIFIGTHFTNNAKRLMEEENIIYIEIGFQIVSYRCKQLAKLMFEKFNFAMAKNLKIDDSIQVIYVKLYYFFYNTLKRAVNVNSTSLFRYPFNHLQASLTWKQGLQFQKVD